MNDRLFNLDRDVRIAAQRRAAEHYYTARTRMGLPPWPVWFVEREQRSGAFWSACARRWGGIDETVNSDHN